MSSGGCCRILETRLLPGPGSFETRVAAPVFGVASEIRRGSTSARPDLRDAAEPPREARVRFLDRPTPPASWGRSGASRVRGLPSLLPEDIPRNTAPRRMRAPDAGLQPRVHR